MSKVIQKKQIKKPVPSRKKALKPSPVSKMPVSVALAVNDSSADQQLFVNTKPPSPVEQILDIFRRESPASQNGMLNSILSEIKKDRSSEAKAAYDARVESEKILETFYGIVSSATAINGEPGNALRLH